MTKLKFIQKLMHISSCLIITFSFLMSVFVSTFQTTLIPYPHIVYPILNGFCVLLSIFLIFSPNHLSLEIIVLFIQSVLTVYYEQEILGTLLYFTIVVFLYVHGYFKSNAKRKLIIIALIWNVIIIALIPHHIFAYCFALVSFTFILFLFAYVFLQVENLLKSLLPITKYQLLNPKLPNIGDELNLYNFNLTQRQTDLAFEYFNKSSSYKELAAKFFISESLVKREMSLIFREFGVKNLVEFHSLLLQYKVTAHKPITDK